MENKQENVEGLNPCCNGIYLMIHNNIKFIKYENFVLILVVMEYT